MRFKNHEELMLALINGKKITYETWEDGDFVWLNDAKKLVNQKNEIFLGTLASCNLWEEFKEPKKITLYRYTYKLPNGAIYQSEWKDSDYCGLNKILKTESKEIEIEGEE